MQTTKAIILVHGTFASGRNGWAARDSIFTKKIQTALYDLTGEIYSIYSFEWSGMNSLYSRQAASIQLMEFLSRKGKDFESIHFIGHSHGGTVIQYALENHSPLSREDTWKSNVKSWTTVGTPFFKFKGIKKHFSAQCNYFFSIIITSIIFCLVYLFLTLNQTEGSFFNLLSDNYKRWTVWVIFLLISGLIYQVFEALTFNSNLDHTSKVFGKKWLGIYSRYDEAIIALKNSQEIKLEISKRVFPSDGLSLNLLFLTRLIFNFIYDYTIRIFMSNLITSNLRNFITGNDRVYYKVKEVSFNPTNEPTIFIPLDLDNKMLAEVIHDNQIKIKDLRILLNSDKTNLINSIIESDDQNKPKLIHSLYFDQDEIIKFILEHILIEEGIEVEMTEWMKQYKEIRNTI